MPSLEMYGPFDFTLRQIDVNIDRRSPGNYALGYLDKNGTFIVQLLGRADSDLNEEMRSCIMRYGRNTYIKFKFSYAESRREAFEKECINYHDFGENVYLDNEDHPAPPPRKRWRCPACNIFD